MSHEFLSLEKAAEHIQIDANELKHVAQRGEIDATVRSGEWFFEHSALDEWAQRNLLAQNAKSLAANNQAFSDKRRRERKEALSITDIFRLDAIDLSLKAKAKAGVIRDMTDLADRTGLVYDPTTLFKELTAREEVASTAVGAGAAFLHPRYHDPYFFEESFVAYARSEREVFFGAPDGAPTRHFFLICSTDHDQHLHILARLAVLAHGTNLIERLDEVTEANEVITILRECEAEYVK